MSLAEDIERAVRAAIFQTVEATTPGWVYVPNEERDAIARRLRGIASEIKGRRFLRDRAVTP
jgi:hypothetical protein